MNKYSFHNSDVVFNEEEHTYLLGIQQLSGITGLIHSVLGLGVYPEASDYVKDFNIPRAGSRGTAIHHAIETYDQLGYLDCSQLVTTKYGCKERDNEKVVEEEWDVTAELNAYIRHLEEFRFKPLANELLVSDNKRYATKIDNVYEYEETGNLWLFDTKTNNLDYYPLCGYYINDYFGSHIEALKEYLSWQLSVNAVLFEDENPGLKIEGLGCNWFGKNGDDEVWFVERKPDELVRLLLATEHTIIDGKFIYDLSQQDEIFRIIKATPAKAEETTPVIAPDVVDYITDLVKQSKEIEEKLTEAKKGLRMAMQQHGVKSCNFGKLGVTLSDDFKAKTFDTKKFKEDHPDLYTKYSVDKLKKGSLTIKLK